MTLEREGHIRAIARARDRSFADVVALVVGLAAETHPDILRNALSNVFDLSCIEETTRRIRIAVFQAQSEVAELRYQVRALRRELDACQGDHRSNGQPPSKGKP